MHALKLLVEYRAREAAGAVYRVRGQGEPYAPSSEEVPAFLVVTALYACVLIMQCFLCKEFLLFRALYAKCPYLYATCPYYIFSALYAKCPYSNAGMTVGGAQANCEHGKQRSKCKYLGRSPRYFDETKLATRRNWPFSVLSFWDKITWICAGAMPGRRDFPATIRI